jgi:hypothetical protein
LSQRRPESASRGVVGVSILTGRNSCVAVVRLSPSKPGWTTPMMVIGWFLIVSVRPTTCGSAPNRCCQYA